MITLNDDPHPSGVSNGSRPGSALPKSPQALLDKNPAGLYPYLRCGDGPGVGIFPGQARELTGAKREVGKLISRVTAESSAVIDGISAVTGACLKPTEMNRH